MTELEAREAIAWCEIFADIDGCNPNHKIMKRCVEALETQINGGWIPFTQREMTVDEKECCGTEEGYMLDCPLPEEDEEILVTYANGTVYVDIFMRDGNECYLDSGNDFVAEAIAWRRMPAPYKKGDQ